MSALAGLWYQDSRSAKDDLLRMLSAQRLYGPERQAHRATGNVAIGRGLLPILPEDRHDRQPLTGGDGRWWLVADVRLDNRDELADLLDIDSGSAAGLSDADFVMRAFEAWGEACLARLYGPYAFALWDSREQYWLLARDGLGKRPLHYFHATGCFAFASMPKGLHVLPDVPYAPNEKALIHALELQPSTPGATCFRDIFSVPAGHVARVDRDKVTVRRHWNPEPRSLRLQRAADYDEAMREALDRAVRNALRGTDAVAAQLSAGLDSSSVVASAALIQAERSKGVVAFTAVPRASFSGAGMPGRLYDEGPIAAEVAALYPNVEHIRVPTPDLSPLDRLDRYFNLYQQPVLNLCNALWIDAIHDLVKARGLKVMLGGWAGNFTLSYRGADAIAGHLRRGRLIRAARETWGLVRRGAGPRRIARELLGESLRLRLLGSRPLQLHSRDDTLLKAGHGPDKLVGLVPSVAGHELRLAMLNITDHGNLAKGVLAYWGIDERDPTADRRFVEFCLSIPAEEHVRDGIPSAMVRIGMADRLPASVRHGRLRGQQAPDWYMSLTGEQLAEKVEDLARHGQLEEFLDIPRLRAFAAGWNDVDWTRRSSHVRYRAAVLRSVSFCDFLTRASGSNG